jgi:hypothetical protein
MLRRLEELGSGGSEAADYYREQTARFEEAESDAKARCDVALAGVVMGP